MPKTLVIIEDDPNFKDKFSRAVCKAEDLELLGMADDLPGGLRLIADLKPDILLVDLGLPSGSGLELIRYARFTIPDCAIMVVTVFGDEQSVLACIEAGAEGYLLKDNTELHIVEQIRSLYQGGSPISPGIARHLLRRLLPVQTPKIDFTPEQPELSAQEISILEIISKGYSYKETARVLKIAPSTVETYIKRIYRKLQVHSKNEAIYEARKSGLLKE
jgi:DNA-binding NarL/FixJ family response regulator